ncbi:ferredoxin reductase [Streptococcus caviae]|uniref:ferredoxin reductase n=1 Tax=Streptococcus sp. 'caviae' TaxID=1915004 RepID=UPI00094BA35B|nr:ferredoxin reductase [Streptococcus sp. 'caviae']OLN82332.1 ferredoxin reductase [Streptococcus sp. 'caviae']
MKRGKKMLMISLLVIAALALMIWGVIAYLGRSQTLTVKSVENPKGDIHLIHLRKPKNMTWKAGSYAKLTLPDLEASGQKSRWLTIASNPDDNEILILTHNSGSLYKKSLTQLSKGDTVEISWLESSLKIQNDDSPLVCFASDVGIAAMRPIVKEWAGKRDLILNHLDKGVTVFDQELSQIAQKDDKLNYGRSTSLSQSKESLKKAVDKYGNKATYLLAGQPDDVEAMEKFLADKGIDRKRMKTEKFNGLK